MLALATGWTPDVIARLPSRFRAACHWALFVRSTVGDEGFPSTDVPMTAPVEARREAARVSVEIDKIRKLIYPEDEDV